MWVCSLQLTPTDNPTSFKAACHRDILLTANGAQGSYSCVHDPTHRRAIAFRATTYKQKEPEGNCLPHMPSLLTKK